MVDKFFGAILSVNRWIKNKNKFVYIAFLIVVTRCNAKGIAQIKRL